MDISKRFDRILQIFFLLQSKAMVTISELQSRFETSKRTIYRDLKALETAGVPISYHDGSGYSISEGFRIQPSRFTQEEVLSLLIAEKMMQKHQTKFIKEQFESVLIKVKSSLQLQQKIALKHLYDKLQIKPEFESDDYLPDIINTLLSSISGHQIIKISYHKSSERDYKIREVEPVGLYFERDFWYVLAFCLLRSDYRNFRLDRIRQADITAVPFTRKHPAMQELREGLNPETTIPVTIRADLEFAHFMFWERDSYGFCKEEKDNNSVIMYFNCGMHPTAFVRWFLRFIDFAEIIEPVSLKTELTEILHKGLKRIDGHTS
ncbi:helix-turn-helix transcriptional regulator [Pedobacter sp. AW31-3R]|uniref:helix-turn-helix transcriptional regulator n=1 Tax=Pedobacter sp. AW31-3R TaxID=3445781 RepID=UPI003FA03A41